MVRKISVMFVCVALLFACGVGAQASAYSVYDGNISNTYVTYFRDIASGLGFTENYVCFRSGQYQYIMVAGDLVYEGNKFTLNGVGNIYTFDTTGSYNSEYTYNVDTITDFELVTNSRIIYSDLGNFPQLISRGEKYEILSTLLLSVALLGIVIRSIIRPR